MAIGRGDPKESHLWIAGGGIAGLAAAVFAIRDANVPVDQVHILEMSQATGREILTELILQMGFEDILDEVLETSEMTTVMMPYASALFACRTPEDRPKVVPDRAANFGFLGQFTEMPEDVVFTVEYSVHGAMLAVYTLLGVDRQIPPIYHGLLDPKVGKQALESLFK